MAQEKYKCQLGFEIFNLKEAKTKEEKIEALEAHMKFLYGAYNDAYAELENQVADLKHGKDR